MLTADDCQTSQLTCKTDVTPEEDFVRRYHAAVGGAIAALAVQAGKGRAVLTGTHPELHPDWLAGAADAKELAATGCRC